MEYNKYYNLTISKIGIGCEQLGGTDWGSFSEKETIFAIQTAFDNGINLFDTANVYGLGRSEQLLSKALGKNIKNANIITKFGVNWEKRNMNQRAHVYLKADASIVRSTLETSLKNLKIDCIPIYLLHYHIPNCNYIEIFDELEKCKNEGKIKHYGVSNYNIVDLKNTNCIKPILYVENEFSLIHSNEALKNTNFLKSKYFIAYGVLAQGLLTGKYNIYSVFEKNDRRHRLKYFSKTFIKDVDELINLIKNLAIKYNCTPAQISLSWALSKSFVKTVLVGVKNIKQVIESIDSIKLSIQDIDLKSLTTLSK